MIKGTARSFLLGSLIVSAAGFSACSDDDIAVSGSGGAEANGGAAIGSGGKAVGGSTAAKAGATSIGGSTVTDTGGATGVGGGTAGGTATGTGGVIGVGGGTAGGTATGTGGTTGVGGTITSGGATTAGNAGRSASGGTAGSSGTGVGGRTVTIGVAGAPQTIANGVAVLTTPLAGLGQGQRYNLWNYDGKGTYDLSSATLNILACAPGALGGDLHIFFTSYGRFDSATVDVPLSALTGGFTTVSIPVPPASGSWDPAVAFIVRIEVEAGTTYGTSWQTPATILYIDRIWTSNGVFDDTFTENYTAGTVNNLLTTSGVRPLAGSTTTWLSQVTVTTGSGGTGGTGGQSGTAGSAGITNVAGNTNIAGNLGVAGSSSTAGNAGSISGGGASAGSGG